MFAGSGVRLTPGPCTGDIEMNLNLFLMPDEAKEEFDMKLAAQKAALQTELTMMGYKAIMQQGLKLHETYKTQTGNTAKSQRVYNRMVFGGAFAPVCVCSAAGVLGAVAEHVPTNSQ